jgi:hypothetical protein
LNLLAFLWWLRYKWIRRGSGIESHAMFRDQTMVKRYLVGCYQDYIKIGSGRKILLTELKKGSSPFQALCEQIQKQKRGGEQHRILFWVHRYGHITYNVAIEEMQRAGITQWSLGVSR